ncbi:MAG: nuclear transport factor 2 family protein [Segniliparus sp.]|uniref:nuclear transport factor 2 family protein n=1 Tax=Segniliparus sp. TaxID=2804064 RepID=UPI003F2EC80B
MATSHSPAFRAGLAFCVLGLLSSGCSSRSAPAPAASTDDAQVANKRLVTDFYELAFVRGNVAQAADQYIGDPYTQHNPEVADGKRAFVEAIGGYFASTPGLVVTVKRVIAEGDVVVVHALYEPKEGPATAVADIFRVADGKIVEHWDVQQPVPAEAASGHPMV